MTASLSSRPRPAPASVKVPEPSSRRQLDEAVARVQDGAGRFARLSLEGRIALARSLQAGYLRVAEDTVGAACRNKGIPLGTPLEGEEWALGPLFVVRQLRLVQQALLAIKHTGNTRAGKLGRTIDGRLTVEVFPAGTIDGLLYSGVRAEVHLQQGVIEAEYHASRARYYKAPDHAGRVALILGAGNVDAIPGMDVITKLFNEGKACVLKMNPVNAYLGPYIECAFAEAVAAGYLAVVYGGAEAGEHLVNHAGVDEIHITGSDKTHDAIVFGGGEEGRRNKEARRPLVTKPITSELGNVSPIIIVPGPWSQADLDFHGANLASMLTNNAGFNCNATRVIVQHARWPQRRALIEATRKVFDATTPRFAYYPGAESRYRSFLAAHPKARPLGQPGEGSLPWLLIEDLDPAQANEICFTTEAFCSVTSEVGLEAASIVDYIRRAVDFANDTLWGTLNAGIIVHPKSLEDPVVAAAVEQAIADLRFGCVVLNHWPALSYALVTTTWGAFPGHDIYDIRSGMGVVHNTLLYDKPQKSVVRGPFRMFPKPPWFATHKTAHRLGEKMLHFEASPSFTKLPGIVLTAMRG
jgi:aldehyde dehydrogenase (NAD(P)+)